MFDEEIYTYNWLCQYRGHYFDSLTEARWAAYFDAVNMQWIREPECFKLPSVGLYTPDFYLPEQDTYAEVKYGNATDLAIHKLHLLARFTGKAALLLSGKPLESRIYVYAPDGPLHSRRNGIISADYEFSSYGGIFNDGDWIPSEYENPLLREIIWDAIRYSESASITAADEELELAAWNRRKDLQANPTVYRWPDE